MGLFLAKGLGNSAIGSGARKMALTKIGNRGYPEPMKADAGLLMSARRVIAAFIALLLVVPPVSANPLAFALANQGTAEDISDPAASNGREAYGEPSGSGEMDSADLAKLGRRLTVIGLSYETFRDASNLDADAELLIDYTSPQGLIPNPADRAQTLDHVYRALALLDYTQALRYPEGETCARANRTALLRSADGLFADPKTGELAPWLKALTSLRSARPPQASREKLFLFLTARAGTRTEHTDLMGVQS